MPPSRQHGTPSWYSILADSFLGYEIFMQMSVGGQKGEDSGYATMAWDVASVNEGLSGISGNDQFYEDM